MFTLHSRLRYDHSNEVVSERESVLMELGRLAWSLVPWFIALATVLAFTWAASHVQSTTLTICRKDGGCKVWTLGGDR